jgi:hypothetical protein
VYVADGSETNHSGIFIMDPANPSANFKPVFGGTMSDVGYAINEQGDTIHGQTYQAYVLGTGAEAKMYTFDAKKTISSGDIYCYNIGNLETPWTAAPSDTIYLDSANGDLIVNVSSNSLAPDGRGGWYVSQYRWGNSLALPVLLHINAEGTVTNFGDNTLISGSYPAGFGVSADGSFLAISNSGDAEKFGVYSIAYDEHNVPTLTHQYTYTMPKIGTTKCYAHGMDLDVANNLYVIDNNAERLHVYALPKAENTFTTPAPSSAAKLTVTRVGGTGVAAPEVAKLVWLSENGAGMTIQASGVKVLGYTLYNVAGMKVAQGAGSAIAAELPAGIYLVEVATDQGPAVKRFIKK